jgi:hypothetical protein
MSIYENQPPRSETYTEIFSEDSEYIRLSWLKLRSDFSLLSQGPGTVTAAIAANLNIHFYFSEMDFLFVEYNIRF